jgi:hypothetical protein
VLSVRISNVATLITPTQRVFSRPILIDSQQLLQLDDVIDRCTAKLRVESERVLQEKANEKIKKLNLKPEEIEAERESQRQYHRYVDGWGKETKTLTISLSRGRELEVRNFAEAMEHANLDSEIPIGFSLFYKTGTYKIRVSLGDSWTDDLKIAAEPNDAELSQAVFGSLCNWAKGVAPSLWQRRWRQLALVCQVILLPALLFGIILYMDSYTQTRSQSGNKEAAHKILEHGIDASNEKQALSLLLAINSDYGATVETNKNATRLRFYLISVIVILGLLSTCPGTAIGLWRGATQVKVYRGWMKFVLVTVPLFVFSAFLRPMIVSWFTKFF